MRSVFFGSCVLATAVGLAHCHDPNVGDGASARPSDDERGGASGGTGTLVWSDAFGRTATTLGTDWTTSGLWYSDGRAVTDSTAADRATANRRSCLDCRVEASVIGFGVPEAGVFVRSPAPTSNDRYDLVFLPDKSLRIRRVRAGVVTVLAQGPSGFAGALYDPALLSLTATGTSPVTLTAAVGGSTRLTATDSSADRLTATGYAGLWTTNAGVVFDDFALYDLGPVTTLDLASPPDGGTGGGVLFFDDFARQNAYALGGAWAGVQGLWLANNQAESNLDGIDLALENAVACAECRVEARVIGFGVPETALVLRAPSTSATGDRYDVVLLSNKDVQVRRWNGGVATVLGHAPSGLDSLADPAQLALAASGAGPVSLTASVNGVAILSVSDTSTAAHTHAGYAGIYTTKAGVVFDNFTLTGTSGTGGGTVDMAAADLSSSPDLAKPADMTPPPDLTPPPDMSGGGGGGYIPPGSDDSPLSHGTPTTIRVTAVAGTSSYIYDVGADKGRGIWAVTPNVIYYWPPTGKMFTYSQSNGLARGNSSYTFASVAGGLAGQAFIGNRGAIGDHLVVDPSYGTISKIENMVVPFSSGPDYEEHLTRVTAGLRMFVDFGGTWNGTAYNGGVHGVTAWHGVNGSCSCIQFQEHQHYIPPSGCDSSGATNGCWGGDTRGLAASPEHDLWVGDQHFVALLPQGSKGPYTDFFEPFRLGIDVFPYANDNVQALAVDDLGGVWVASYGQGLAYLAPMTLVPSYYDRSRVLPQNRVTAVAVDPYDDSVWVATVYGGIARKKGSTWIYYRASSGLPTDGITSLYMDNESVPRRVIIGTDSGVFTYNGP